MIENDSNYPMILGVVNNTPHRGCIPCKIILILSSVDDDEIYIEPFNPLKAKIDIPRFSCPKGFYVPQILSVQEMEEMFIGINLEKLKQTTLIDILGMLLTPFIEHVNYQVCCIYVCSIRMVKD